MNPVTGKERRRWHRAGTTRQEAERLATRLVADENGRNDQVRALTFGAYLTTRWLPGKKINLAHSTRPPILQHGTPTLATGPRALPGPELARSKPNRSPLG